MVTPTEPTGKMMALLESMLEASAVFQAQIDAPDTVDAHINPVMYRREEDSGTPDFPIAIIERDQFRSRQIALGAGNYHQISGTLALTLIDEDENLDDPEAGEQAFANFAHGVLTDLLDASGDNENMAINAVETTDPPERISDQSTGEIYWRVRYILSWGNPA